MSIEWPDRKPKKNQDNRQSSTILKILIAILVLCISFVLIIKFGELNKQADFIRQHQAAEALKEFQETVRQQSAIEMKRIKNQVAADAVTQYGIAKRNGMAMDVCVQAGLVSAAFLQADDEDNYRQWKLIEKEDCAKAGIYH